LRIHAALSAILLLLAPVSAQACLAAGPDGYVTGLVWDNAPSELPAGAYVVRIEQAMPIEGSLGFTALVTDGPRSLVGKRYRFVAQNLSSCVGFGSLNGFAVVAADEGTIGVNGEERAALQLVDYAPTTYNEVVRTLFGGSQWRYPGEPAEKEVFEF